MSPSSTADEGLFRRHLEQGRKLHASGKHAEAEKQLEEAYLLRPRDLKVLNLLGLIYFKQDKYAKAEEVYRKLAAENPDAHTLHYNLGLIYLKLDQHHEAEQALLRAQQLGSDTPKINFYLGTIYERMGRLRDSIYQYRHAGAHIMARRLLDKIDDPVGDELPVPEPIAKSSPESAPGPGSETGRGSDPDSATPPEGTTLPRTPTDTDALNLDFNQLMTGNTEPFLSRERRVQPVGPAVLARERPDTRLDTDASESTPRRFRKAAKTLPPHQARGVAAALAQNEPQGAQLSDTFKLLRAGLLEVGFSGKAFVKQGTVYSYSGNLTFWVKDKRPGGRPALVIVSGKGRVVLTDNECDVMLLKVADEPVYVEPNHVLACEESLTPRYITLETQADDPPEFLTFDGRGTLALAVASRPLTISVSPDLPVSIPAASVIAWSGSLSAHLADNLTDVEPLMFTVGATSRLLRLDGVGQVLVERG
jgi:tetratricopeptide (TPR) repeat protein